MKKITFKTNCKYQMTFNICISISYSISYFLFEEFYN